MNYKYEIHCHCKEISPCGHLSAHELAKLYEEAGYAGIVLTDHFRGDILEMLPGNRWEDKVEALWTPYSRLKREYEKTDFFIGRGMEIRFNTNGNDILLYGFSEELFLEEGESWLDMGLPYFWEKYHNKMLIIQAHPNRRDTTFPEALNYLHGIEVKNTSPRNENHNELSEQTVKENPWLIATGGSDCHRVEDVARSGICSNKRIRTEQDLISILKNKEFSVI